MHGGEYGSPVTWSGRSAHGEPGDDDRRAAARVPVRGAGGTGSPPPSRWRRAALAPLAVDPPAPLFVPVETLVPVPWTFDGISSDINSNVTMSTASGP